MRLSQLSSVSNRLGRGSRHFLASTSSRLLISPSHQSLHTAIHATPSKKTGSVNQVELLSSIITSKSLAELFLTLNLTESSKLPSPSHTVASIMRLKELIQQLPPSDEKEPGEADELLASLLDQVTEHLPSQLSPKLTLTVCKCLENLPDFNRRLCIDWSIKSISVLDLRIAKAKADGKLDFSLLQDAVDMLRSLVASTSINVSQSELTGDEPVAVEDEPVARSVPFGPPVPPKATSTPPAPTPSAPPSVRLSDEPHKEALMTQFEQMMSQSDTDESFVKIQETFTKLLRAKEATESAEESPSSLSASVPQTVNERWEAPGEQVAQFKDVESDSWPRRDFLSSDQPEGNEVNKVPAAGGDSKPEPASQGITSEDRQKFEGYFGAFKALIPPAPLPALPSKTPSNSAKGKSKGTVSSSPASGSKSNDSSLNSQMQAVATLIETEFKKGQASNSPVIELCELIKPSSLILMSEMILGGDLLADARVASSAGGSKREVKEAEREAKKARELDLAARTTLSRSLLLAALHLILKKAPIDGGDLNPYVLWRAIDPRESLLIFVLSDRIEQQAPTLSTGIFSSAGMTPEHQQAALDSLFPSLRSSAQKGEFEAKDLAALSAALMRTTIYRPSSFEWMRSFCHAVSSSPSFIDLETQDLLSVFGFIKRSSPSVSPPPLPPSFLHAASSAVIKNLQSCSPEEALDLIQALIVGLQCPPLPTLTESVTSSSLFQALFPSPSSSASSSSPPASSPFSAKKTIEAFAAIVSSKITPEPHQVCALLSTTLKGKLMSAMHAQARAASTRDKGAGGSSKGFSGSSSAASSSSQMKQGGSIRFSDLSTLMSALSTLKMAPTASFLSEVLEASSMSVEQLLLISQEDQEDALKIIEPEHLILLTQSLSLLGLSPDTQWQQLYHRTISYLLPQCSLPQLSLLSFSMLHFGLEPSSELMARLVAESLFKMQQANGNGDGNGSEASDTVTDPASLTRLGYFIAAAYKSNSSHFALDSSKRYKPLPPAWFQSYLSSSLRIMDEAEPDLIAVQMSTVAGLGFIPPHTWMAQALTALSLSLDDELSPAGLVISLASLSAIVGSDSRAESGEAQKDQGLVEIREIERSYVSSAMTAAYKRREDFTLLELMYLLDQILPRLAFAVDGSGLEGIRSVTDLPSYVSLGFARTVSKKREEERVRVRKAALEEERWKKSATGAALNRPMGKIHIDSLAPGEVLIHSLIAFDR